MTPQELIRALAKLPMRNENTRWSALTDSERRMLDWLRATAPAGVVLTADEARTVRRLVEVHGEGRPT